MFSPHSLPLTLLLALQAALTTTAPLAPTEYISAATATSRETFINRALITANALNHHWFSPSDGLWNSMWWQSANFLTTTADLTELAPDRFMPVSDYFFQRSVARGRRANGGTFHNEFYDDEGWWAMALIRIYDVTGKESFLEEARETFEDMKTGRTAICGRGGHWWSNERTYIASIANELYLNVAAALGNRTPNRKQYYRKLALANADWFLDSGLITTNNTVKDGLDIATCEPTGTIFTYNSGVILSAFAELTRLTSDRKYIENAHAIAQGAMTHLVDDNGILTEVGWPADLDPTRAMFKGVFVRNLKYLHRVEPRGAYVGFLQRNADALWEEARRAGDGMVGPNWQGGEGWRRGVSSQGSGFDLFVAAAAVSG